MKQCRNVISHSMLTIAAVAVLLTGCASPASKPKDAPSVAGPVFYPALPNSPRIQLLTTFASERDLAVEKDSFASFIAGDEKESQRLVQPYGVTMDQGRLYVADTGAGGLAIFDLATKHFSFVTGSGGGRMKRPINIRIDTDGTRYITDTGRDQILVFDRNDHFVKAFGNQGQFRPVDVAIADKRLYVTDIAHQQIQVLDKATGKVLFTFGKPGSGPGELFHPTSIALGPDGDIYVVETSNFRVQRFTAEGKPVRTYGEVGSTSGSFARPKGLAIDRNGHIFVSDAAFQNVQIFDKGGKLLMYFGETEDSTQGVNLPSGVSIDYKNVDAFQRFADPKFRIEYLILVASQFGPNKVDVFGFGKMDGLDYAPQSTKAEPVPRS